MTSPSDFKVAVNKHLCLSFSSTNCYLCYNFCTEIIYYFSHTHFFLSLHFALEFARFPYRCLIKLRLFNVFCRAARRAFQHVINSDTGGSSIAQYWLLALHMKKNDLPAAMVGNDFHRWRDFALESVVSPKRLQLVVSFRCRSYTK